MRRIILGISLVLASTGCGSSQSANFIGTQSAKPAATSEESTTPTVSPTVNFGGAVISGDLGVEPLVEIDPSAPPAAESEYSDIVVGDGAQVHSDSTVTAHYVGYGMSTGQMFDGSWSRGEPTTFPLSQVIIGWQEGLTGMKVGGRRALLITADKAYGDSPPAGSGIEPGETLLFVVDLVGVE